MLSYSWKMCSKIVSQKGETESTCPVRVWICLAAPAAGAIDSERAFGAFSRQASGVLHSI